MRRTGDRRMWRQAWSHWRAERRGRRAERERRRSEHQRGRERSGQVGRGGRDAGDGFTSGF